MNSQSEGLAASILGALGDGLPILLLHFVVTLLLLAVGVTIYTAVTPFHERALMVRGNMAAGTALSGAVVGLAIPLAALLATSGDVIDIVVWGVIAVLLQLLTMGVVALVLRDLGGMIEADNRSAAGVLAATQIAVGLLNAACMVPV